MSVLLLVEVAVPELLPVVRLNILTIHPDNRRPLLRMLRVFRQRAVTDILLALQLKLVGFN